MLKQLLELQPEINQVNTKHGFWEQGNDRNKGEMVMLMITELSEAVEAHREDNRYDATTRLRTREHTSGWAFDLVDTMPEAWLNWFRAEVKNTVSDEIADTVIRLLDYCHGWDIVLIEREYRKESTGNFANDVLRLVHYCLCAYHESLPPVTLGRDWGCALAAIIKFCEWYDIDLVQHCIWKLRYNKTRPHKHGKAY